MVNQRFVVAALALVVAGGIAVGDVSFKGDIPGGAAETFREINEESNEHPLTADEAAEGANELRRRGAKGTLTYVGGTVTV